jgi:hypothetical protein
MKGCILLLDSFVKTGRCEYSCKQCKGINKKRVLFKSVVDEYVCLNKFLFAYFTYRKVSKMVNKMTDKEVAGLVNSTLATLKHEQIKREWQAVKSTNK